MATLSPPTATLRARLAAHVRLAWLHPASRLLALVYVAAVLVLAAAGEWSTLALQLALTAWTLLTALLAVTVTTPTQAAWSAPAGAARPRLWAQLAVVAVVILYTLFRGRALRAPALELVPVLGPLTAAINRLDFSLANPLLYVAPALLGLLLLGARPAELGLALPRTRADWRRLGWLVGIMGAASLAFVALHLTIGGLPLPVFGRRLLANLLQNGFSEEFLFRGALMTRLARLSDTGWGLVVSSVVFGVWHLDANLPMFGGQLLPALAFCLVSQAIAGVGYAIAFQRGVNLAAPTLLHILSHFITL